MIISTWYFFMYVLLGLSILYISIQLFIDRESLDGQKNELLQKLITETINETKEIRQTFNNTEEIKAYCLIRVKNKLSINNIKKGIRDEEIEMLLSLCISYHYRDMIMLEKARAKDGLR